MKWILLTTAPNQLQAEMWRALLLEEGLLALVRPGDTVSFPGSLGLSVPHSGVRRTVGARKGGLGRATGDR